MTRISLAYPKIPGSSKAPFRRCVAFEKYDGTNLHWVWDWELEWHAFGTRRDRYDLDSSGVDAFNAAHVELEEAADIFRASLATPLANWIRSDPSNKGREVIVFTERSWAVNLLPGSTSSVMKNDLLLIDVAIDGQMLPPEHFVNNFSELPIAKVIYRGKLTGRFAEDVRSGKYSVAEGVVMQRRD